MITTKLPQRVIDFLQSEGWTVDYYVKWDNLDYVWAKVANPQVTLQNPIDWERMGTGPLHPEIEFTYDVKRAKTSTRVKLDGGFICGTAHWWGKPFGREIFRVGESTTDDEIRAYLETLNQPIVDAAHLHIYEMKQYHSMFFDVLHYYTHQNEIMKLELPYRMAIRYFLYTYNDKVHKKLQDELRGQTGSMRVLDLVKFIHDTLPHEQYGTGFHHFAWAIDYLAQRSG